MKVKSLPAVFLILIMALQCGGILLILKFQQQARRYEMHYFSALEKDKIESLTLSKESFEKNIDGKELLYNGKLYDVYSWEENGDSVNVLAINDTDEEHIVEHIKNIVSASGKKPFDASKNIKIVLFNFIQPLNSGLKNFNNLTALFFCRSDHFIAVSCSDNPSPPPRTLFYSAALA